MSGTDFGSAPDGRPTHRFRLVDGDLEVDVTDFGATVVAVRVPDRDGRVADVVLGHDHVSAYADAANPYLGATVGRVANRIGGAAFTLDGRTHRLAANDGDNHLHGGGARAFSRVVWELLEVGDDRVTLVHVSPDGEEGYPGGVEVTAAYHVVGDRLEIEYRARADARTPVSLTNHAYVNLAGEPAGDVLDHRAQVFAHRYTPVGAGQIPTGEIAEVAGTPLDLRQPTRIGDRLPALADDPGGGIDHNFVVDGEPGRQRPAARVEDPASGRTLEVHTDQPGVQFYTGNMLDGSIVGRAGTPYRRHAAFCLEPQGFPDAVNQPAFPSVILDPGAEYVHRTHYRFGVS
ncbi:aldose epimerase family protein [Egicoccus sp. AB-alg2]|uniref:aldose epimerase family protein n=1 Tax=Egicoccus sp. AB-alg2 TaxID=3242693 RepID=UPI00359E73A6